MGWDWSRIRVACALAGNLGAVGVKLDEANPIALRASNASHFLELGEIGVVGDFALKATALAALANLPDSVISNERDQVAVSGNGFRFGIAKLPPMVGFPNTDLRPVGLYEREFLRGVESVQHASGGPVDSITKGIRIVPWKGAQVAVCQDGRRWACAKVGAGIPWEATINPETIGILRKLWAEDEEIEIAVSPNAVSFRGESWKLRAALLQGEYQDCLTLAQGFADQCQGGFLVDWAQFREHISRAKLFAKNEESERLTVSVVIGPDGYTVESSNTDGRYAGTGETEGTGVVGQWEWNPDFALAWLNQAESEKVRVGFSGPGKAIVLSDFWDNLSGFSGMISPLGKRGEK